MLVTIISLFITEYKALYYKALTEDVGESILLGSGNVKEVIVSKEIAEKIDFYENVKVRYID